MKNLVFFLIVICLLAGCSNSITNTDQNAIESAGKNTSYANSVYYLVCENAENVISFPVPHRNGISAEEMTFIQNYLQNELLTRTGDKITLTLSSEDVKDKDPVHTESVQYSILMESRVAYDSATHVSIVWTGLLNKKGTAHPTHCLLALNYNPQTLQIIPFSRKYIVDKQLYSTFSNLAAKMLEEECNGILPSGWDSFYEPICSEKEFIDGLNTEDGFYYYLQDTGVVISYPVPFAMGDHKEVVIAQGTVPCVDEVS